MLHDFYTVKTLEEKERGKYVCQILFNDKHEIFKGHFPNNPIVPGVCMLQIIKNISEDILGEKLFMSMTSNVKFMALINPETTPIVELSIEIIPVDDNCWTVKNVTSFGDTIAMKLTNTYRKICS